VPPTHHESTSSTARQPQQLLLTHRPFELADDLLGRRRGVQQNAQLDVP
jgi:hypothetical protein